MCETMHNCRQQCDKLKFVFLLLTIQLDFDGERERDTGTRDPFIQKVETASVRPVWRRTSGSNFEQTKGV